MSSDLLDVLNISGKSTGPPLKKQKISSSVGMNGQTDANGKVSGINRELYQLLGSNTPPVPIRNQQKFKDRLNALSKPSSWSRIEFKIGARSDGLRLKHWVKGSKESVAAAVDTPYKFEKYNTRLNIPTFTQEDYDLFLAEEDNIEQEIKENIIVDDSQKDDSNSNNKDNNHDNNEDNKEDNKEERAEKKQNDVQKGEKEQEVHDAAKDGKEDSEKENSEVQTNTEETVLKQASEPWDYKETRYLFDLASSFDLKWIVIHDRYNFSGKGRLMEELQERFYSICQRILIHENEDEETATNSNLISNLNFNKNKEVERKAYLNRLLNRSPAEIAEEESLLIEARKFEASAKKTITERAALLQLLDSPQAGGSISQYLTSQGLTQLYNTLMTEKRKRRVDSPAPENPLTLLNEKIKQQQLQKQKQIQLEKQEQLKKRKENPIFTLLSKNLTPKEEEAFGLKVHAEKISPGVYLRSNKVAYFKPGVQNKITGVLNELGLGKKPSLATEKVISKQEELLKTIGTMLDLKRQLDKLDAETKILK